MNDGYEISQKAQAMRTGASVRDHCHLVIVDDEPDIGEFLSEVGSRAGYDCTVVTDTREFAQTIRQHIDVIMLDLVMPGTDGVELLRVLANARHTAQVILMSGVDSRVLSSARSLAKALGLRVMGQLQKPIRAAELEALLLTLPALIPVALPRTRTVLPLAISLEELTTAIRDRQFEIHYQPQIEFASKSFVGVEALVRWRHPSRGLLYPDAFIGLAEETGAIDSLSWMIFEQAAAEFRGLFVARGPLNLSLNLSACSLHDLTTPERLTEIALRSNLPPSCFTLEITESGLMRELTSALDILTRIRRNGMALSIDDFGTGYSMMNQLRRVPASELKIDRSFINDATHDESALVMVEKTLEIGRRLRMRVVAEGVETTEQAGMLRALGCEVAQGYLFSRPVAMPSLLAWATAWGGDGRQKLSAS